MRTGMHAWLCLALLLAEYLMSERVGAPSTGRGCLNKHQQLLLHNRARALSVSLCLSLPPCLPASLSLPPSLQALHLTNFGQKTAQLGTDRLSTETTAQISETEACLGSIFLMRSDRKEGLGDNESCGACALTRAGTVTHSARLRSGCRRV